MAGNKAGGITLRQTMIGKFGSEEAWKEHMRTIASKGGKKGTTGGFWHAKHVLNDVEFIRQASIKGGRVARKRKNEVSN